MKFYIMKSIIFSAVLTVMCLFGLVSNVSAQDYKGTLSNVTMNGKHFNNVENQVFSLSDEGNGIYLLTGQVQKIGRMPGTINIDLKVSIVNGIITPIEIDGRAGKLSILGKLPVPIKLTNITGNLSDNTIHFVLDTYAGWKAIPMFPASVTFDGTLQP